MPPCRQACVRAASSAPKHNHSNVLTALRALGVPLLSMSMRTLLGRKLRGCPPDQTCLHRSPAGWIGSTAGSSRDGSLRRSTACHTLQGSSRLYMVPKHQAAVEVQVSKVKVEHKCEKHTRPEILDDALHMRLPQPVHYLHRILEIARTQPGIDCTVAHLGTPGLSEHDTCLPLPSQNGSWSLPVTAYACQEMLVYFCLVSVIAVPMCSLRRLEGLPLCRTGCPRLCRSAK